ncbi:carboxylesterase/lipase family protein [Kribbella sp. NPDC056951]|uniref:carboxylesterase/lipase family protein n=1 Tax=Kribbella sp. NPDC056951 TaxID=3345978 RepID=UPI0036295C52
MVKILALALAALLPAPVVAVDDPLVVRIEQGAVRGVKKGEYREFNGIPYAAPPVGALRWRSPQPAAAWTGVRAASAIGPRCAQAESATGTPPSIEEDCLYLNVTTPAKTGPRKPVMVWLHGGGFVEGSGGEYDPHRLAVRGEVVVVTINYRLGIFGNFGYPGLDGSGAFGIEDQQAALRWVRQNAAAFGGDPGNVTLFGQSAGGQSVCAQLAAPAAAGLFDRAIIQSSLCTSPIPANALAPGLPTVSPWEAVGSVAARGRSVAATHGCSTVDCLRLKSPTELMPVFGQFAGLAYGSSTLPENPAESRAHDVPMLSGTTRDEMTYVQGMVDQATQPLTSRQYRDYLVKAFGEDADRVARRYPLSSKVPPSRTWASVTTDSAFACPTLKRNQAFARHVPTYAYEFADRTAPPTLPPATYPYGAYHSADALYLFALRGGVANPPLTSAQRRLSDAMIDYWSAFARTGNPNMPGLPHWPRLHPTDVVAQSLARTIRRTNLSRAHNCDLWSTIEF